MNLEEKIGSFWVKKIKGKDEKYLSGFIEIEGKKYIVLLFKNNKKQDGKNHPDWELFLKDVVDGSEIL